MVTGDARIDQTQVTVGTAAQQSCRRYQVVVALLALAAVRVAGGDEQMGVPGEVVAPRLGQITGWRISPPSTVEPRMTPERIRNVPVVRSFTPSNRIRTGPTNE